MNSTLHTTLAATLVAVATLGTLALPAQARERTTTVTGANGHGATRQVTRAQGDVHSSTTSAGGQTMSRDVERSAGSTTATVTGPNGRTATRTSTTSVGTGKAQ